jgi:hypothetical protein
LQIADICYFNHTGTEEQWLKPQGGNADNSIPDTGAPASAGVATNASGVVTSDSGAVPVDAKQPAPA